MAFQYEQLRQVFLDELALESLDSAKRDEMLEKVMEVFAKRVFVDTMDRLGDEGVEEYKAVLEKSEDSTAEAEAVLRKHIPNYDEFLQEVLKKFLEEIKEDVMK